MLAPAAESTTAPQALLLFNSEVSQETAEELAVGTAFLQKHTANTETLQQALADYCLAVLNSNAFVWVD